MPRWLTGILGPVASSDVRPTGRRRSDSCSSPNPPTLHPPSSSSATDNAMTSESVHPLPQSTMTSTSNTDADADPTPHLVSPQPIRPHQPSLRVEIPPATAQTFPLPVQEGDAPANPWMIQLPESPVTNETDQEINFPVGTEDMFFDDEGLTTLEKIYLFARSPAVFHRVFVSRSLPTFLPDVVPIEAVEYVLPLLNSLGTDEEESVKEAFVAGLVPTMWWFFTNCKLVEEDIRALEGTPATTPAHETQEDSVMDVQWPLIPVQVFTPLLGSLLLSGNTVVADAARSAVVELLARLRSDDAAETSSLPSTPNSATTAPPQQLPSTIQGPFGPTEQKLLEKELLFGVVIGMARLDQPDETFAAPPSETQEEHAPESSGQPAETLDSAMEELDDEDIAALEDDRVRGGEDWLGMDPLELPALSEHSSTSTGPSSLSSAPPENSQQALSSDGATPPDPPTSSFDEKPLSPIDDSSKPTLSASTPPSPASPLAINLGSLITRSISSRPESNVTSPVVHLPEYPFPPISNQPLVPPTPPPISSTGDQIPADPYAPSQRGSMGQIISAILPRSPPLTRHSEETLPVLGSPFEDEDTTPPTRANPPNQHITSQAGGPQQTSFFASLPSSGDAFSSTSSSSTRNAANSAHSDSPLPSTGSSTGTLSSNQSLDTPSSDGSVGTPFIVRAERRMEQESSGGAEPEQESYFDENAIAQARETSRSEGGSGGDRTPPKNHVRDRSGFLPRGGLKAQASLTGLLTPPKLTHETPIDEHAWAEALSMSPKREPADPPARIQSPSLLSLSSSLRSENNASPTRPKLVRFSKSELAIALAGVDTSAASLFSSPPTSARGSRSLPDDMKLPGFGEAGGSRAESSGGSSDTVQGESSEQVLASPPDSGTGAEDRMEDDDTQFLLNSPPSPRPGRLEDDDRSRRSPSLDQQVAGSTHGYPSPVASPSGALPNGDIGDVVLPDNDPDAVSEKAVGSALVTSAILAEERSSGSSDSLTPTPLTTPNLGKHAESQARPPLVRANEWADSLFEETEVKQELRYPSLDTTSREDGKEDIEAESAGGAPSVHLPRPGGSASGHVVDHYFTGGSEAETEAGHETESTDAAQFSAGVNEDVSWNSELQTSHQDLSPNAMSEGGVPNESSESWLRPVAPTEHSEYEDYGTNSEEAAIGRVASMSLIAAVTASGVLGEEPKDAFVAEVLRVGKDQIYWVRREASFALGALAKVVPQDVLVSSLLPLYEQLSHDPIWHVRQSALFALPGLLTRLEPDHRYNLALAQCQTLSADPARSVRSGLLEVMGELIYCFHEDERGPPPELLDLFVGRDERGQSPFVPGEDASMNEWLDDPPTPEAVVSPFKTGFDDRSDSGSSDAPGFFGSTSSTLSHTRQTRDPERVLICAFNFPAVVATLGGNRWKDLRQFYHNLAADRTSKVRRTIGASIGEIARIIGGEQAREDLISVWWEYIRDEDSDVRIKVIGALEMFIAALEPADRVKVAEYLETLWDESLKNWREREALTMQFAGIAEYLGSSGKGTTMKNLLNSALVDRVAAVREAAVASCTKVFEALENDPTVQKAMDEELLGLAEAASFRQRVMYVGVCYALVEGGNSKKRATSEQFWSTLTKLSKDAVVDVRIGASRLVALTCDKYYLNPSIRPASITGVIRTLSRDSSKEVKSFVSFLIATPGSPMTSLHSPSSSAPHPFATFSRPPPTTPASDEIDDLVDDEDLELEFDLDEADTAAERLFGPNPLPTPSPMELPHSHVPAPPGEVNAAADALSGGSNDSFAQFLRQRPMDLDVRFPTPA